MKALYFLVLAILALEGTFVNARNEDICRIFFDGTVIANPESCSGYITCNNHVATYSTCGGSTPYFDKDKAKCVAWPEDFEDDNACKRVSCTAAVGRFISDPKSCFGYYYCADEETPMYNSCPDNTHFNETTQSCTWKDESECKSTDFDYCSIIKDGVNFDDVTSCDSYYSCKKGVLTSAKCKSQYYNTRTGKCVMKSLVYCPEHPLPDNVCGKASKPKKNEFVSDGATCRGYLFCAEQADGKPDPNPSKNFCPYNTFFDATTQSCRDPIDIKCTEDRCDGRTVEFVLSGTKGCRNYLRCKDQLMVEELSCGNYFFDEHKGACVSEVNVWTACKT
ncbi:peritrophin-44 [Scaptodrosophila lebanonensis]|uniref:Peritrophin-44 n=1 Tax=Drosophila lebanonensis TaxID=7225 RepID=A0A6J2T9M6_DROLE|nr:peritrophin-44 [Scaptodrosophila lebanonensis]